RKEATEPGARRGGRRFPKVTAGVGRAWIRCKVCNLLRSVCSKLRTLLRCHCPRTQTTKPERLLSLSEVTAWIRNKCRARRLSTRLVRGAFDLDLGIRGRAIEQPVLLALQVQPEERQQIGVEDLHRPVVTDGACRGIVDRAETRQRGIQRAVT